MNSCKCKNCNVDVHGASYAEHPTSKKHLEKKTKWNDYTRLVVPGTYWK